MSSPLMTRWSTLADFPDIHTEKQTYPAWHDGNQGILPVLF